MSVYIGYGMQIKRHIIEKLNINTAQSEHDERAKGWMLRDTHDDLHSTLYHLLDNDAIHIFTSADGIHVFSDVLVGFFDFSPAPAIKNNSLHVCLLSDGRR